MKPFALYLPKSFLLAVLFGSLALPASVFAQSRDFTDQTLASKNFTGANLDGADFSDATLNSCVFSKASLKGAHFKDAVFYLTTINGADLTGADLRGVTGSLMCTDSNLNKANLEGLDIKTVTIYGSSFKEANLRNTKNWLVVGGCDFYKADLRGANLRGAISSGYGEGLLAGVRFKGALYDETTSWPDGFDPVAVGAVLSKAAPTAAAQ